MDIRGQAALVTGGGSGLGAATARMLADAGAKVAILDVNDKAAAEVAIDVKGVAIHCDVADSDLHRSRDRQGGRRSGPGAHPDQLRGHRQSQAHRRQGRTEALADYERVIRINLIGTFNAMRLAAAAMQDSIALADGERGVIICTASVAAYEGQIGQAAYASSKGGVVALVLPAAREFAQFGVRVTPLRPAFSSPRC